MEKKVFFLENFLNVNREWCANSQIHGLSFLSKAKNKLNLSLWSIVIFLSVSAGITAIVGVILEYFEYKVVESIKFERTNKMIFPSITLCNYLN